MLIYISIQLWSLSSNLISDIVFFSSRFSFSAFFYLVIFYWFCFSEEVSYLFIHPVHHLGYNNYVQILVI